MLKFLALLFTLTLSINASTGFKNVVDFTGSNEIQVSNAVASTTLGAVVFCPKGTYVFTNNYTLAAGQCLWLDSGAVSWEFTTRFQKNICTDISANLISDGTLES